MHQENLKLKIERAVLIISTRRVLFLVRRFVFGQPLIDTKYVQFNDGTNIIVFVENNNMSETKLNPSVMGNSKL
jgi:hypothetical protein